MNLASWIVLIALLMAVLAALFFRIKRHKANKACSCGYACMGCPSAGYCDPQTKQAHACPSRHEEVGR